LTKVRFSCGMRKDFETAMTSIALAIQTLCAK
jgi:hypothetical protein